MKHNILIFTILLALFSSCSDQKDYDATGTFEATEVVVSAEATGKILAFDVEEGSLLEANQVIGYIDSLQLNLQREILRQQQSAILAGKPDVQKQVKALREQISKQQKELERLRRMEAGGAATPKQIDDVEAQIAMLQSQLDASLQTLDASVANLDGNAAAVNIQIKALDDQIHKCRISSPIDGTVLIKYVQAGEMAIAGRPIMKVADLNHIFLRAYLTSEQLSRVSLGQKVTVIADFGGEQQTEYPGTVQWIAGESEFTPKSIQTRGSRSNLVYAVKIAVPNDGKLKIGLYGEVLF